MTIELRTIPRQELRTFMALVMGTFGDDLDPDDSKLEERVIATLPLDRTFAAYEADTLVGTGADFPLEVSVPGGAMVPLSGLTMISVSPSHRRQGILTSMMERHLAMAHQRGEPLGGLWASEASIYSRYGYGVASDRYELIADARLVEPPAPEPGIRMRMAAMDDASLISRLGGVFEQVLPVRPGMLGRTPAWWEHHRLYDPPAERNGGTAMRCAFAEADTGDVGYVLYRVRPHWNGAIAEGSVEVVELVSESPTARRALWNHLLRIDLFPTVKYWGLAADDPLRWEVANPRHLRMTGPIDGLWIRLVSVPDALTARRYTIDGRLTMSVGDTTCPWNEGTYELVVEHGYATCSPSSAEPDLHLDATALSALYLGGRNAVSMGAAGRIRGSEHSVARLDRLFRWPVSPWCPEIF